MKIGIITMVSDNYGNRLQNYALQQILKNLGTDVETFHNPFLLNYSEMKHILKKPIKTIIYSLNHNNKGKVYREKAFDKFNRKYIIWSKFWLNDFNRLPQIDSCYDAVICGSDQIWNPESYNIDGRYFATFMREEKRFSYAASFGLAQIPKERRNEWIQYLNGMRKISVREDTGRNIVKALTDRNCEKNLDPTLLLSAAEWRTIERRPEKIDFSERYILTYFLGKPNEEQQRYIQYFAKKEKCQVLELNRVDTPNLYSCGPSEFLYLIDHAKCILTDSFHGTVFSILFKKQFIIFERNGLKNSMSSRIDSLLDTLELENSGCRYKRGRKNAIPLNFERSFYIISEEKKRSIEYLTQILELIK